jgi:hypothetical protein
MPETTTFSVQEKLKQAIQLNTQLNKIMSKETNQTPK